MTQNTNIVKGIDIKIYLEQSFKMVGIVLLVYSMKLQQQMNWWFLPLLMVAFIFYVIFPSKKIVDKIIEENKQ